MHKKRGLWGVDSAHLAQEFGLPRSALASPPPSALAGPTWSATTDPSAADSSAAAPPATGPSATDSNQLIEEYCHKLEWKMLVRHYKQDPEFQDLKKAICRNMANLDPELPYTELPVLFPAFTAVTEFCTPFIARIHMEEVNRRLASTAYRNKVLTAYARQRLADVRGMNWAELGWLIETFIGEVICKKGMKLGDFKVLREFTKLPFEGAEPKQVQAKGFRDGQGVVLLPDSYFFKYTDFVVVFKSEGVVHIIAGQITMNPKNHRKSEQKFVKKSYVQMWVPDVSEDELRVHYAFFSPTKVDLNLDVDKEADAMEYQLHASTFLESFADGITEEDCKLLEELEEKRKEAMEKSKQSKKERRSKMDPAVLNWVDKCKKAFLQAKARKHQIWITGTKERIVKSILDAGVMEDCGGPGRQCAACAILEGPFSQLRSRRRPRPKCDSKENLKRKKLMRKTSSSSDEQKQKWKKVSSDEEVE
ncbi:hypothetical protein SELMODRAFT_428231 [Selaginella moellendorffii]|uniref:Uncharacterized protein n=1 Tax=Selaginella moellendorffii TaxID=88036 RepID=D8T258_SELML|nr:hypothetical protein SELMODRAFT_428231 [Selaginella moellendorffii]